MKTDADLLLAARTDASAFRELYERHAAAIHGYHLRRSRDAEAAHDLTAETFARAWLCRDRFEDRRGGAAAPWLFGIARHVLLVSVRAGRLERGARERLHLLERDDRVADPAVPDAAWLDGLDEALADLPPGQGDAIRLRVVDDLSYEEVAEALCTTPGAARVRVHRGLAALRQRLTQRMETAP